MTKHTKTTTRSLPETTLSPFEIIALSKAVTEKEFKGAKGHIAEGETLDVDLTVRIHGVLSRGEGYEKRATSKLLSKAVLALLLRRLGATGESATELLADVLREAAEADKTVQETLEEDPAVKLAFERVEAAIGGTTTRVEGAIKAVLAVERV